MRHYTVKLTTAITVEAETPEEAKAKAFTQGLVNYGGRLWVSEIVASWSDNETIEDINRDISKNKN